jgi:predicted DNA-binding protein (UPF0251 family)
MARPKKWRRVTLIPTVSYFKPAGVSVRGLEDVCLTVEEVEAMRLKHLEGLHQNQCADSMHVSRATFQRVLNSAYRKTADALSGGKALCIEGGDFGLARQPFRCAGDGHEWSVAFETLVAGGPPVCPRCGGSAVVRITPPSHAVSRRSRSRRQRRHTGADAPRQPRQPATGLAPRSGSGDVR